EPRAVATGDVRRRSRDNNRVNRTMRKSRRMNGNESTDTNRGAALFAAPVGRAGQRFGTHRENNMVTVTPEAKEQYPIFFRWMNGGFYGSVAHSDRIMDAFFKWSNFSDTYDNRTYFKYGTPPMIDLIPGSNACQYNSDGTPTGV